MKSGKQRRAEIRVKRVEKREKERKASLKKPPQKLRPPSNTEPVQPERLAPYNSYGDPDFVQRGYYIDKPFACKDCGKEVIWTASQQKWWYEVAKGQVYTTAIRCRPCRPCRRKLRERSEADHKKFEERVAKKPT